MISKLIPTSNWNRKEVNNCNKSGIFVFIPLRPVFKKKEVDVLPYRVQWFSRESGTDR